MELLLSKLHMIYYPEPDSHIRDKVKVVLELSNYATKKELNDVIGVNISNVAGKRNCTASKGEVDKLHINELVNVSTDLNNLKQK